MYPVTGIGILLVLTQGLILSGLFGSASLFAFEDQEGLIELQPASPGEELVRG
jgi:hypothetical protein